MRERTFRIGLVTACAALFSVFVVGLAALATSPLRVASLGLAYTSGLSMIVLPCTLPAVFVIVPLALGRDPRRGVAMALLFGLGLTVTITGYTVAVAFLGKVLYLDRVTLLMWLVGASAAYLFGLAELGLIPWRPPSYGGPLPAVLHRRGDYLKALGMGLLLGNAGIGCPNPAFYVLLTYVAGSGSAGTGAVYGLVHGIGRTTPLLALAILAILGIDATGALLHRRRRIERLVGWSLVGVGALLLPKGYLFGHAFWEESVFHKVWNAAVHALFGSNIAESAAVERALGDTPVADPWLLYGPWGVIALLLAVPILWNDWKRARARQGLALADREIVAGAIGAAFLAPAVASAHGDDTIAVGAFVGPMLGLLVLVSVVGIGRAVIRTLVDRQR